MPYIPQEHREDVEPYSVGIPADPGELNYAVTRMCLDYLGSQAAKREPPKVRYQDLNDIIGVLECAKQEFYRRVIAEYEDRKKQENGDVF